MSKRTKIIVSKEIAEFGIPENIREFSAENDIEYLDVCSIITTYKSSSDPKEYLTKITGVNNLEQIKALAVPSCLEEQKDIIRNSSIRTAKALLDKIDTSIEKHGISTAEIKDLSVALANIHKTYASPAEKKADGGATINFQQNLVSQDKSGSINI